MASPRVLVVDDDPSVAELTALQLAERDEFETIVETSADDGLSRLEDSRIDCIVSDYDMPGRDGLEFLSAVRERDEDLPFILFTGKGSEDIASRAISARVTDYLRKGTGTEQYDILANRIRNAVDRYRTEQQLQQTESQVDRLLTQNVVGIYVVQDGELVSVNEPAADLLGYTPSELRGRDPLELIAPEDRDRVTRKLNRRLSGEAESEHYTVTALHRSGGRVEIEVHGGRVQYDGDLAILGVVIEAPDRTGEDLIRALDQATIDLVRTRDRVEICEITVRSAVTHMDLPAAGVFLSTGEDRLEAVERSDSFVDLFGDATTLTQDDERLWEGYHADAPIRVSPERGEAGECVVAPLARDGVLVVASETAFDALEFEAVKLLSASTTAALTHTNYEERLAELHEATRELMSAATEDAVAQATVETARDVLGFDISSVHRVTEDGERLVPIATTQEAESVLGSVPAFESEDAMAWRVYEEGSPHVYEDVRDAPTLHNPETPIRSELILPLGDYGVFLAGSTQPEDVDESTASLARVFAANVEAALRSADREERLREREAELERQNERLEEFASVVSHDLRNPLNVAEGHLDLARERTDEDDLEEWLDAAHEAMIRMSTLIDDLLTLARQGRTVGETEPVSLADFVTDVWDTLQTRSATLELDDDLGQVEADPERLRQLFVNLLRNALDHADSEEGVTVRVGSIPHRAGFYVADDGPGIPAGQRDRIFDHGYTTSDDGTGFGLAIVRNIAQAHGWAIEVTESEAGGARFEIYTDVEPEAEVEPVSESDQPSFDPSR